MISMLGARPPSRGAVPGRPFRRRRGRLGASSSDPPTDWRPGAHRHKAQRQIGAWHTRCLVPRLCASCRVRPSAAPIIQRAHKQPWRLAAFIPSTFARAHDFVFSPEDAGAQAAADAATNASHNLVLPLRFCRTGSVEKGRRALRRRPCPTTATGRRVLRGLSVRRHAAVHLPPQSKLSTAHRLPLDRLASLLMREAAPRRRQDLPHWRSTHEVIHMPRKRTYDWVSTSPSGPCATPTRKNGSAYEGRTEGERGADKVPVEIDRALRAAREAAAKHALEQF